MDLKARMRNKAFWVALTGSLIILAQQVGLKLPDNSTEIINTILLIGVILGIFVDTSTKGVSDHKTELKDDHAIS